MIHVYLDDYRSCPRGFVLARSAEECKLLIDHEDIDILSLDYDLGWGQDTGYEVARHLVETGRYPKRIYLHTSSVSGKLQMYHLLSSHIPDNVKLYNGPMSEFENERGK
ncbi:cell division protein FtsJ [Paenibacillus sp. J5C_2022]|uniref:cyclic-phosphate processing receiver domain-containing protein n=1 Tax=Paenibacillus sp. J5C2022 TaxID=2977129 RepID=UPI0021CE6820|nr:cyclic-phosphate processing receiver domain-containing protein [Paenibacillus sp. J5C2022]MCU6708192.1 cell division protein FtsJ [Paenibacillus sp. J5C2022]